jgi:ADP-ribose pyrophosphatase YjhB (NUDIX family)
MTRLLRTIRLDPSDALVFPRAAEPGEWAVPGGFCFWDDEVEALEGKRRQAFRAGFLGLGSFGWSTLVQVVTATPAQRAEAVAALAAHVRAVHGAPDDEAARAAAEEEIAFAESLCDQPPGTLVALTRSIEGGEVRERFRTLHERTDPHRAFETLPVFAAVAVEGEEEEVPLRPDLARMARAGRRVNEAPE